MPPFSAATVSALPIYSQPDDRQRTAEVRTVGASDAPPWERLLLRRADGAEISGSVTDPWRSATQVEQQRALGREQSVANERLVLIVRKHTAKGLTTEEEARLQLLTYRLDGMVPKTDSDVVLGRLESRVRAVDDVLAEADRLLASTR